MFLVLIFTRDWVDPRAMVRSEGIMSQKNPVTTTGIDPGTVRLVSQRLDHYATPGPQCVSRYKVKCTLGKRHFAVPLRSRLFWHSLLTSVWLLSAEVLVYQTSTTSFHLLANTLLANLFVKKIWGSHVRVVERSNLLESLQDGFTWSPWTWTWKY